MSVEGLNRMKRLVHEFAILNWEKKREGKLHIAFMLDFFFGSGFCSEAWVDHLLHSKEWSFDLTTS